MRNRKIVILGSGIAGVSAAKEIRKYQPDTEIVMISDENELPYLRPLLSKTYLRTFQRHRILIEEESWYQAQGIRLLKGKQAESILPAEQRVVLAGGGEEDYDACIYALGAHNFIPPFSGADQAGIYSVRTVADLNRIRSSLAVAEQAVVIGGGVIGLEMAWEIAQIGLHVTVLEAGSNLMGRLLDEQSAGVLAALTTNKGINVYTGIQVEELTGSGNVTGVRLADGRCFAADLVVISCGIRANIEVARRAGLSCERGVIVSDRLETSALGIYAAGDCIQGQTPNPGLWNYSRQSGEIAGYNAIFPLTPEVFCPQPEPVLLNAMDTSLFAIGTIEADDVRVEIAEPAKRDEFLVNHHEGTSPAYSKRFYRQGQLCGAVLIGDLSQLSSIKQELGGMPDGTEPKKD